MLKELPNELQNGLPKDLLNKLAKDSPKEEFPM